MGEKGRREAITGPTGVLAVAEEIDESGVKDGVKKIKKRGEQRRKGEVLVQAQTFVTERSVQRGGGQKRTNNR